MRVELDVFFWIDLFLYGYYIENFIGVNNYGLYYKRI